MFDSNTYSESTDQMLLANGELIAISELLQTPESQELHLSEPGRTGLARMLSRIATVFSEATCNLPTANELEREIDDAAMARAASIAVTRMANKGAEHE